MLCDGQSWVEELRQLCCANELSVVRYSHCHRCSKLIGSGADAPACGSRTAVKATMLKISALQISMSS